MQVVDHYYNGVGVGNHSNVIMKQVIKPTIADKVYIPNI